jgi:hypothetical protein
MIMHKKYARRRVSSGGEIKVREIFFFLFFSFDYFQVLANMPEIAEVGCKCLYERTKR